MIEIWTTVIACACFGWLAAEGSGIVQTITGFIHERRLAKWFTSGASEPRPFEPRLKPFDCPTCLAFWLALAVLLFQGNIAWYYTPLLASISSALATLISKQINK